MIIDGTVSRHSVPVTANTAQLGTLLLQSASRIQTTCFIMAIVTALQKAKTLRNIVPWKMYLFPFRFVHTFDTECYQIFNPNRILDKRKLSEQITQNVDTYFIYWINKSMQQSIPLCEKVIAPLYSITDCATFSCSGSNQTLPVVVDQSLTMLAHSSMQNWFNSVTSVGFQAWTAFFKSCHNISIGIRSELWLGPSKTSNLLLFKQFSCILDCVFWVIVFLHDPDALQLQLTDGWPDILLYNSLIQSRIHGSIY